MPDGDLYKRKNKVGEEQVERGVKVQIEWPWKALLRRENLGKDLKEVRD